MRQTATGYWVVQRGAVQLAGAVTRQAAEAERDLRERLHERIDQRHQPCTSRSPQRSRPRRRA